MIKTLAKSIREYKKPSILSPIFVSIEVILECLMPLVIVWFMDALETSKTSSELMNCILVYGGSLIGHGDLIARHGHAVGQVRRLRERRLCEEPAQGYVLCDPELFVREYSTAFPPRLWLPARRRT